jgi:hypothetical protein
MGQKFRTLFICSGRIQHDFDSALFNRLFAVPFHINYDMYEFSPLNIQKVVMPCDANLRLKAFSFGAWM